METPYRIIEEAKERATRRGETLELKSSDDVAKIEERNGKEVYRDGFTDYHKT